MQNSNSIVKVVLRNATKTETDNPSENKISCKSFLLLCRHTKLLFLINDNISIWVYYFYNWMKYYGYINILNVALKHYCTRFVKHGHEYSIT